MHVEQVFVDGKFYKRNELFSIRQNEEFILLLHAFALNNDAAPDKENIIKGDSTEVALLEVALEQNIKPDVWPRLAEIAFDSERKLMTTFHKYENRIVSLTKGAPDIILERCSDIGL
jgi:Ca2+-transporting ATPase